MPEAGDQTGFLAKTVSQGVIGIGRQELQRDESFLDLVVCPVDAGGAAAAETLTQQVAADPLIGLRGLPVGRGAWGRVGGFPTSSIAYGFGFLAFVSFGQAGGILRFR